MMRTLVAWCLILAAALVIFGAVNVLGVVLVAVGVAAYLCTSDDDELP